ncbi:hypothetical protein [Pseudobutyrivibrio sp.]|uniref:hypothetical protein n=1 Tax=Pseudobutyrivibrio sp. TaxID=2014367 RepID=UPI00386F166D
MSKKEIHLSDVWVREIHTENQDNKTVYTFAGALEKCYKHIAHGWNLNTQKQRNSAYENIIIPALAAHNEKTIDQYTIEDYEAAIQLIRDNGYVGKDGIRQIYSESTIRTFEQQIYVVVFYSATLGFCDNCLWGTRFELDTESIEDQIKDKINEKVLLKKSLTVTEEKHLFELLLSDEELPGEYVAVLLMASCGLRNAESCALNYGDIIPLFSHDEMYMALVYKTTIPFTSNLQSSGKTWNAGRMVPIPQKTLEVIKCRKQETIDYLRKVGMYDDVNIDELPIASKGYISDGAFDKRCASHDVTNAAKDIFKAASINGRQLAYIDDDLRNNGVAEIVNEKDATAYLLRRNFATHLQILGFNTSEIQYLLGHDVEDIYESRSEFVDEDRLWEMGKRLLKRPLLNDISNDFEKVSIPISIGETRIKLIANETNDNLKFTASKDDLYSLESYVTVSERPFSRQIDILKQYYKRYN